MEVRKKKPAGWMKRFTAILLVVALLFAMGLSQVVQVSIARQSQAVNELSAAVNALVETTDYLDKNTPERMLELIGASLSPRDKTQYAYTMASVHIGRQEYARALGFIDQCIRLYSDNDSNILTELWFKKGCLLTLTDSDDEALSALDHALSINPKLADAHYVKMQIHVKQGNLALAVRDVEMYRRLTGGQDITAVQGDLYAAQEIYAQAVTAYDQALLANPNNWHALFMRGLSHLQLGNYELSLDDFSSCIQYGQEAALSRYYRGVLLLRKGEYALAEADFDAALQGDVLGQGVMELWFNRGVSRMAQGKLAAALEDFTESARQGEAVGESLINSGICLQELGQSQEALERYASAQENGIAMARLSYYRARTYSAMGDHSLAVSAYTSSIDGDYELLESFLQRGAAYYALGAYEEAVIDFSACISADYKSAEALYLRGMTYLQMGRDAESQMDLEAAITAGEKI
jgi:tetratricopeptide (TPR) repeat protein